MAQIENTAPDKMQFLNNRVRFLCLNFLIFVGDILLHFTVKVQQFDGLF